MSGCVMLVTPNLDVGGAQETVVNLARQFPREGWPVVVCSFRDGPLRSDLVADGITVELLQPRQHSVVALPWFLSEIRQYRRSLQHLVEHYGVTVVLSQGLGSLDFLLLSIRSESARVWWTIQNALFTLRPEHLSRHAWLLRPKRFAHRWLYRLGAARMDGIIAVSDETAEAFVQHVGCRSDQVRVVYNAVDTERLPVAVPRPDIRAELEFEPGVHLMIMVGTFKRQKGHSYLIEAAAKICPRYPHLRILLAGDGELRRAIEDAVGELGLQQQIVFLGTRRDVPEILAAADSFVMPSLWEGLSLALMEAMASSLPVVATDVSGSRLAVLDGVTGWIVEPGDAHALDEAMDRILEDPTRSRAMGQAGRARAEELFSVRNQTERLIAIFEEASQ
jgi:glycosyltransferase involved in cell wall biosynthesis